MKNTYAKYHYQKTFFHEINLLITVWTCKNDFLQPKRVETKCWENTSEQSLFLLKSFLLRLFLNKSQNFQFHHLIGVLRKQSMYLFFMMLPSVIFRRMYDHEHRRINTSMITRDIPFMTFLHDLSSNFYVLPLQLSKRSYQLYNTYSVEMP